MPTPEAPIGSGFGAQQGNAWRATDPVAAGRLWQLSEQLTGVAID